MQASLLQAAIEGKLTTQDPKADGKQSDLLKQIQAEKQRLIDAKEIKREKPHCQPLPRKKNHLISQIIGSGEIRWNCRL